MKQKNNSSNIVTKEFLKDELVGLETRIDIKLDRLERRIDDKAQGYRDQVLTSNDKLAKTLETIREDIEIGNFQVKKQIKSHEERIKNIEKIQQAA